MTCRVARSPLPHPHVTLVSCHDCGSPSLEAYSTSRSLGPHQCQACAQSMAERETTTKQTDYAPRREPCAL